MIQIKKFDYHFRIKKGWQNDPNGLCRFGNKYHAFYQYNPHDTKWDTIYWGHAFSDDLLSWEEQAPALNPDMYYEEKGCFSGNAIVKDGVMHLFYTSYCAEHGQCQNHAYSTDGKIFKKDKSNPIIEQNITEDFGLTCDPFVFELNGIYYMVLGYTDGCDTMGKIKLCKSSDMCNWEYVSILYESTLYGAIECPNMMHLDGKWVLQFSARKAKNIPGEMHSRTVFLVGEFDGRNFTVESEQRIEWGVDFYAPQIFKEGEEYIMLAWTYHCGRPLPPSYTSAGAFTVPRRVFFQNGKLCNFPISVAERYLKKKDKHVTIKNNILTITYHGKVLFTYDLATVCGIEKVKSVDILRDGDLLEIFLNGGEASITRWLLDGKSDR